jgi:hypothetical protein
MQEGFLQVWLDGADIDTDYLRPNQYTSLPVTGVKMLRMNVQYLCFRMLVRCTRVISFQEIGIGLAIRAIINRPYTSSSSNIENAMDFLFVDKGGEQFAAECHLEQVMLQIWSYLSALWYFSAIMTNEYLIDLFRPGYY